MIPASAAEARLLDYSSSPTIPTSERVSRSVALLERRGYALPPSRLASLCLGGAVSEEFQVLAESGEDAIVFSDADDYAANLEAAAALPPAEPRPAPACYRAPASYLPRSYLV